jgi:hypothetical protein
VREPVKSEGAEIKLAVAVNHPLRQGFADGGRMLEAVAGTGRNENDLVHVRVAVDHEARVGRDRIKASFRPQTRGTDTESKLSLHAKTIIPMASVRG